jgi:cytochrome c oxidase subunit 2
MEFPLFPYMPPDLSVHGKHLDELNWWVHIIMAVLFVGWGGFFVYTLVRFRARKGHAADYAGVQSHFSTYHEVAVVVVECVLLFALAIPLWANWVEFGRVETHDNPVRIRVIAQQFAWNAHYPGPDGKFGRTRVSAVNEQLNPVGIDASDPDGKDDIQLQNQLIIPKGREVVVDITSKDVIHSFFLPVMRVKQDAVPGLSIPVGFQATKTSMEFKKEEFAQAGGKYASASEVPDFEIACAQLCGAQHYKMVGKLYITSAEDFADLKTRSDFMGWGTKFRRGQWDQLKEGAAPGGQ